MSSQWIAFGAVIAAIAGRTYAFVRKGSRIKPDADSKPPPDTSLPGSWS